MSVQSKDEEVRAVVAELDALLAQLQANVDALTEAMQHVPQDNGHGQEVPAQ